MTVRECYRTLETWKENRELGVVCSKTHGTSVMIITDWLHTPSASQTPVEMKKFSLRLDDVVFKVEDLSRQERRTEAETKRVGGQESGFLPPGNKIHCRVIRSYNVYLRIAAKWEKAVLKNKSVLHCWFLQCFFFFCGEPRVRGGSDNRCM